MESTPTFPTPKQTARLTKLIDELERVLKDQDSETALIALADATAKVFVSTAGVFKELERETLAQLLTRRVEEFGLAIITCIKVGDMRVANEIAKNHH